MDLYAGIYYGQSFGALWQWPHFCSTLDKSHRELESLSGRHVDFAHAVWSWMGGWTSDRSRTESFSHPLERQSDSLFDWNPHPRSLILTVSLKLTEICHVALSRAPLNSSHFWKASDSGNIERVPSLCALLWCVLKGSFSSWFYYSKDMELHLTSLKNLI